MAGPAIRAWQIAKRLSSEHDVVLATTSGRCELAPQDFSACAADPDDLIELEAWCDVIVLQGFLLQHVPTLRSTQKIMIVDLYDPLHLEQLALFKKHDEGTRRATLDNATAVLNEQLLRGDFFICASSKQRDFWLGQLAALGRVNPKTYEGDGMLRGLIEIVPFGLPDAPPTHTRQVLRGVMPGIEQGDDVILWGGGVYNWLDPLTLIEAVDRLRRPARRFGCFSWVSGIPIQSCPK
jgi:hypothetical protein